MNKTFLLFLMLLMLQSCSSESTQDENQIFEAKIISLNSWLNLMPGGPPSFHIAGEISVSNNSDVKIVPDLTDIIIYQNGKMIYKIHPFFESITREAVPYVNPGQQKKFLFGTKPGLEIKKNLNQLEMISAEFIFKTDEEMIFKKMVDSLFIEKAY